MPPKTRRGLPAALVALAFGLLQLFVGAALAASPGDVRAKLEAAAAPTSQLVASGVRESFGTRFHHFAQEVDGIPVLGTEIVVTDSPGTAGDLVLDTTRAGIDGPGRAAVSKAHAVAAARARATEGKPVATRAASLAILPTKTGGRLVWRVELDRGAGRELLIDARSGAVVRDRSLGQNASGRGSIFDPDAVQANNGTEGLSDNNDADTELLTSLRREVALERLEEDSECLRGEHVHAFLPETPPAPGTDSDDEGGEGEGVRDVCAPGRDFSAVTRSDDAFEVVMAYFHIDRAQEYIQSLGFSNARRNGIVNRQIPVRVNFINEDNSNFRASEGGPVTMGTGGVDDGEDAEVFVHEYGHAIQHSQSPRFNGDAFEANAIGEAFSDYFASSISMRFRPSRRWDGCWAPWDNQGGEEGRINPNSVCERPVDSRLSVSQLRRRGNPRSAQNSGPECRESFYCIGTAWSGALFTLRGRLGGRTMDKTLLQSQFSYPANGNFQQVSLALLAADRRLNRGRNQRLIRSVLCQREVLRGSACTAGTVNPPRRRPRRPRFTG